MDPSTGSRAWEGPSLPHSARGFSASWPPCLHLLSLNLEFSSLNYL